MVTEIWLMEVEDGDGLEPFWYCKRDGEFTRPGIPYEKKAPRRSIREVLKQILPLIPVDTPNPEEDFSELKHNLEECAGSWFAAPEIEMPLWMGVAQMLEEWLEDPKRDWPDWKWQILAIFIGPPFSKRLVMDSLPE